MNTDQNSGTAEPFKGTLKANLSVSAASIGEVSSRIKIKAVPLTPFRNRIYRRFGEKWMPRRTKGDYAVLNLALEMAYLEKEERFQKIQLAHEEALKINEQIDLEASFKRMCKELLDVAYRKYGIILVMGAKGASATTTTAVYLSVALGLWASKIVILADGNPAAGMCADRFNMNHGDTWTIQQYHQSLQDRVRATESGLDTSNIIFRNEYPKFKRTDDTHVSVVAADNIIFEDRRLSGPDMLAVLTVLSENSEIVVVDSPNDVGEPSNRVAAELADGYIFTANCGVPGSLKLLFTTMESIRNQGKSQEEKVRRSVVVISNMPLGKTVEDYRKYLNEVDNDHEVVRELEHQFDGVLLGVYSNPEIAKDTTVNMQANGIRTNSEYVKIATQAIIQSRLREVEPPAIHSSTNMPATQPDRWVSG